MPKSSSYSDGILGPWPAGGSLPVFGLEKPTLDQAPRMLDMALSSDKRFRVGFRQAWGPQARTGWHRAGWHTGDQEGPPKQRGGGQEPKGDEDFLGPEPD